MAKAASVRRTRAGNVSHLCLVRAEPQPNNELVRVTMLLARLAAEGRLQGISFAGEMGDGTFITDTVGTCHQRPTFALGMVSYLADEIRGIQHRMGPADPR